MSFSRESVSRAYLEALTTQEWKAMILIDDPQQILNKSRGL